MKTANNLCSRTIDLAKKLISINSITPNDNGCQNIIKEQLAATGFSVIDLSLEGVSNIWAQKGDNSPLFVFAGHTDVVPPGQLEKWHSNPFQADLRDDYLYGRGAADMKSALAAMIIACQRFVEQYPEHRGSIGFIITSDEEGDAKFGTIKVVEYLQEQRIQPRWCLIGEASSSLKLGDTLKIGRRGSLHGNLQVFGKQGHIAYPQLAENPIHRSFKVLDTLTETVWDKGNEDFTPTSFQIYNIKADTGASNVIPGILTASFNFRYSPASTAEELKHKVHKIFDDYQLNYEIEWKHSSEPFLSHKGKLLEASIQAIKEICEIEAQPNTTGGTSDGRFIHKLGCEIVELGPPSKTAHQVNECISLEDLSNLTELYFRVLEQLVKQ